MRRKWIFAIPLIPVFIALFIFVGGEVVMHLWNWLTPTLFGWHQITFWQAFGVLALCRVLFGGFGRHGSGRFNMRRRMEERRKNMTPEERERFRQGMRERCGFGPAGGGAGETSESKG
jgi:hypothetical protein